MALLLLMGYQAKAHVPWDVPRSRLAPGPYVTRRGPSAIAQGSEFGPLIISNDIKGNNLFEQNKARFNERKGR